MVSKRLKYACFSVISSLQSHLKNFLDILHIHPRYLECAPGFALSNETSFMVIRHTWREIFAKNPKLNVKKTGSPHSTVATRYETTGLLTDTVRVTCAFKAVANTKSM